LDKLIREKVESRIAKNMRPFQKRFERLLQVFEAKPHVAFTIEERAMLENPFPILLASTKTKSFCTENQQKEFHLKKAKLGQDVDLSFVYPEDKLSMEKWLVDHNLSSTVKVRTIDILNLLDDFPLIHSRSQVTNLEPCLTISGHQSFSALFSQHVAPLYKMSYPDGSARIHHGVPHAARVSFFALTIAELYKEENLVSQSNISHLLLAAALHDCARENDGVDFWDEQSGEKCREIIIGDLNGSDTVGAHLKQCIAKKDAKAPFSLDQKIIHDADCIEIVRCLYHPEDFIPDELWILKDLDQDIVFTLIAEAKVFIALTEKDKIKELINNSNAPMEVLYQILEFAAIQLNQFPLLLQVNHTARDAFCLPQQYKLNSMVEEIIIDQFKK
jgi:hypothetical protein